MVVRDLAEGVAGRSLLSLCVADWAVLCFLLCLQKKINHPMPMPARIAPTTGMTKMQESINYSENIYGDNRVIDLYCKINFLLPIVSVFGLDLLCVPAHMRDFVRVS